MTASLSHFVRRLPILGVLTFALAGCHAVPYGNRKPCRLPEWAVRQSQKDNDAQALATDLCALGPSVDRREAEKVAQSLVDEAMKKRRQNTTQQPPYLQNVCVNFGLCPRGLCYQWREDFTAVVASLRPKTLQIHWAASKVGTGRDHNVLVLTERGRSMKSGLVMEAWRTSGTLMWVPVAKDSYPWHETHVEERFLY
jgi:hypothetical protein